MLLALLWVLGEAAGRMAGRLLEGYERAANAAGQAVVRGAKAVLAALGPLGRELLRLLAPLGRLLRRLWDQISGWLLLRMFRPMGRWAR